MAGEWKKRPLGELTENFDTIRVPVKEKDRVNGPYPYYGASGIVDYVDSTSSMESICLSPKTVRT